MAELDYRDLRSERIARKSTAWHGHAINSDEDGSAEADVITTTIDGAALQHNGN
jgi:hypothetical protein